LPEHLEEASLSREGRFGSGEPGGRQARCGEPITGGKRDGGRFPPGELPRPRRHEGERTRGRDRNRVPSLNAVEPEQMGGTSGSTDRTISALIKGLRHEGIGTLKASVNVV